MTLKGSCYLNVESALDIIVDVPWGSDSLPDKGWCVSSSAFWCGLGWYELCTNTISASHSTL